MDILTTGSNFSRVGRLPVVATCMVFSRAPLSVQRLPRRHRDAISRDGWPRSEIACNLAEAPLWHGLQLVLPLLPLLFLRAAC